MMRRIWEETVWQPSVFLVKVHPKWITCAVCRCFMHTAVVIVPLFSFFFMHIGLIFRFKLFRDTGKAEICVQCQLCRFNKMFDPFFFFFLQLSLISSSLYRQELWIKCLQIRRQFPNRLLNRFWKQQYWQLLHVWTCWSSWVCLNIRGQQANYRKTSIDQCYGKLKNMHFLLRCTRLFKNPLFSRNDSIICLLRQPLG